MIDKNYSLLTIFLNRAFTHARAVGVGGGGAGWALAILMLSIRSVTVRHQGAGCRRGKPAAATVGAGLRRRFLVFTVPPIYCIFICAHWLLALIVAWKEEV